MTSKTEESNNAQFVTNIKSSMAYQLLLASNVSLLSSKLTSNLTLFTKSHEQFATGVLSTDPRIANKLTCLTIIIVSNAMKDSSMILR